MAGPSFKPGEYEKLPGIHRIIYWFAINFGMVVIAFLLIKAYVGEKLW